MGKENVQRAAANSSGVQPPLRAVIRHKIYQMHSVEIT